MSHPVNEKLKDDLRDFMEERGLTVNDIMQDERGAYYLAIDDFSPDQIDTHVMYLPLHLQEIAQMI